METSYEQIANRYRKSLPAADLLAAYTPGGAQTLSKMPARYPYGAYPTMLTHGHGARVWDVDGNSYVDWSCALGAISLGYGRREVDDAVIHQVLKGVSFSLPHHLELTLAEELCAAIPCAEMVRFVKTGSEATEAAIRTARIATGRDIILTVGTGYHCYADGTEVLTDKGFREFKDVHVGDLVATRNPVSGDLEYQPVEEVFAYPFDGMAAQYKTKGLDLLVTADHRMMVVSHDGSISEDIARNIAHATIPTANHTVWEGKTPEKMIIPSINPWSPGPRKLSYAERQEIVNSHLGHSELARRFSVSHSAIRKVRAQIPMKSSSKGINEFSPDLFAEFLGYFLSEGFCLRHAARPRYEVHLCQNRGNIKDRMRDVVKLMGFVPVENKSGLSFASKELWTYLLGCGVGACNKFVPKEIKTWGVRELRILLDAMIDGDGTRSDGRKAYYTTSKQLADDVCEIALKIGWRATVKMHANAGSSKILGRRVRSRGPIYHIRFSHGIKSRNREAKREWVHYSGMVRCVRTSNGTLYVRRNGFPAWCGNSWHSWFQAIKEWHPGVPKPYEWMVGSLAYNQPISQIENAIECWYDFVPNGALDDINGVAAIILEPTLFVPPASGWLQGLRDLCTKTGALLIFDEMVTGFRWALAGGQEYFGVTPDLATFGKGCANGYPLAFLCGKREYMQHAELISGTFGGETASLAACKAVLGVYRQEPICDLMRAFGERLQEPFKRCPFAKLDGYAVKPRVVFTMGDDDTKRRCMSLFLQETALRGVLIHPGGFNVNAALTNTDIEQTVGAFWEALRVVGVALESGNWSALKGALIRPVLTVRKG